MGVVVVFVVVVVVVFVGVVIEKGGWAWLLS